jgi:hypothetical protein
MEQPVPGEAPAAPFEPDWSAYRDEELLQLRICDLGVRIEGSELEPRVAQLHAELEAHGLLLRPPCYLGDEWFTPTGRLEIAVPFYLAHPRLKALELRQVMEVEGGTAEWCQRLLRHECGHAIDHAHRFSRRRRWRQLFGQPDDYATPDIYRPRPYSKSYVRHLQNWYAQAHPDEDFAETFAVWLGTPKAEWRARYRGWKALEKLEYVDSLMAEAAKQRTNSIPRARGRRIAEASRCRKTLQRYYAERRKRYAEEFPDFYDADLRAIFEQGERGEESAARYMRRHRKVIVPSLVRFTGQHKYTVDQLVRKLTLRCESLQLTAPRNEARLALDLSAYLAALVTNHLHTGRFKRSV